MDVDHNNPIIQDIKDTSQNGEVQEQSAKTSSELHDFVDAHPSPTATGQPLTHYHSMFYRLLSWKNPRTTAITFVATILFIVAARYLNILRYLLKALYMILGITATAEIAGHIALGGGLTSKIRPKKYFVIQKDSLQRFADDFAELLNFFVIEFQRILFAENIWVTVGAFLASFIGYWLVKVMPLWGLVLIADSTIFLAPLIYIQNKELIDHHIMNAGNVINDQANQMRELATQQTDRATEMVKQYTSEYTKKAQDMMGSSSVSRQKAGLKTSDFPTAPKNEPVADTTTIKTEPQPEPAS